MINRQPDRVIQSGIGGGASIATVTLGSIAGHGDDRACRLQNLANTAIKQVSDVDIARIINNDAAGVLQRGSSRRAPITAEARGSVTRHGTDHSREVTTGRKGRAVSAILGSNLMRANLQQRNWKARHAINQARGITIIRAIHQELYCARGRTLRGCYSGREQDRLAIHRTRGGCGQRCRGPLDGGSHFLVDRTRCAAAEVQAVSSVHGCDCVAAHGQAIRGQAGHATNQAYLVAVIHSIDHELHGASGRSRAGCRGADRDGECHRLACQSRRTGSMQGGCGRDG